MRRCGVLQTTTTTDARQHQQSGSPTLCVGGPVIIGNNLVCGLSNGAIIINLSTTLCAVNTCQKQRTYVYEIKPNGRSIHGLAYGSKPTYKTPLHHNARRRHT